MKYKAIIDKVPEAYKSKAKVFNDPNGQKYSIEFDKKTDLKIFLAAYNSEFENQAGESYIWMPSPWWFADGRQYRIELLNKKK